MAHRKIQCWIFCKTGPQIPNILCLLLKTNKLRGEFWQPITGNVEPGEGFFEAACREPVEETGFIFSTPPIDTKYEFEFIGRFGETKERIFALAVDEPLAPRLDPNEHTHFQWIEPMQAIPLLKYPSNIEGLKMAFLSIFGKALQ